VRWRARTIVQPHSALRASRPQLKRDPLGTHGAPFTSSTSGLLVFLAAGGAYLVLAQRLSRHRMASSRPWWLETWGKGLEPGTYTREGQELLARLRPWIFALFALEIIGIVIFVANS